MKRANLMSFLLALTIVTYSDVYKRLHGVDKSQAWNAMMILPKPRLYVYVAIVWGVLGILAETGAAEVATLFGFGLCAAMFYSAVNSGVPILVPKAT